MRRLIGARLGLGLLAVASLAFLGWFLLTTSCGRSASDISNDVPLGSKLADLDGYLRGATSDSSEVIEWVSVAANGPSGGQTISDELGTFTTKPQGSYYGWKSATTPAQLDRFTGEIIFMRLGVTADIISFTYYEGRLRKKDWGFLPG